ncbi:MAG: SMP-30/gluconolactonase/LRE family protein [Verrucomicrobiales bacterium]|nr:SMP-30/gluconolactonase/LRE family protein [Verrucomicrobiales bacterium]
MIFRFIALCLLLPLGFLQSAEISTVAGPEGLNNTFGVIVGLDGDIYFCDTGNHAIKKIDRKKGTVTTVVGTEKKGYSGDGGPPLKADLFEPYEVRFHRGGDLYWVEMQNHIVRKLDARTNLVSTVAGTGEKGFSGDGGPATTAKLHRPHSIQFDQAGENLYICDIGNHRIRKVSLSDGTIDTWCGNGKKETTRDGAKVSTDTPLKGPRALDIAPDGDLWLALREGNALYRIDMKNLTIHHVAGTGKNGYVAEPTEAKQAPLSGPKGVAVSPDGNWIYLADTESHTVRAVDLRANPPMLHSIAGTGKKGDGPDNGDPANCQMARLHGVGIDPVTGDLYIGDSETNKIRKITGLPGGLDWKPLGSYRSENFELNGVKCRVTSPDKAKDGNPWIWRCRFYGAFPGLDEALLASGWHIAWTDVGNLFGGPEAMSRFDAFYSHVRSKYQLAEKPVMEGFSRGGLPAANWSIQNPDKVLALYIDAAVMSIHSWPKNSSEKLYETALQAYGLDNGTASQWQGPLDNLAPLAAAKIPVFIVAGGADPVVPFEENTGLFEMNYTGPLEAIVKATCGHHPHGLYGPANYELVKKLEALR